MTPNQILCRPLSLPKIALQLPRRDRPIPIDDERLPGKEVRIDLTICDPPKSKSSRRRLNGVGDYVSEEAELFAVKAKITIFAHDPVIEHPDGAIQSYRYICNMRMNDGHEYWGEKGRSIGENSSIDSMELCFAWESAVGIFSERFRISQDSILCVRRLYEGIMSSSSVSVITLFNPMYILTDNQLLPTLKLSGDGVFPSFKRLSLHCQHLIREHDSICIASHLENLSLDHICMSGDSFKSAFTEIDTLTEPGSAVLAMDDGNSDIGEQNRSVILMGGVRHVVHFLRFKNILFACGNVKQMFWCCDFGDEAFNVLAQFLQQPSIRLERLQLQSARFLQLQPARYLQHPSFFDPRLYHIIAEGLKNNSTVKHLQMRNSDPKFLIDVLCDTNSIESVINSNHTLTTMDCNFVPSRSALPGTLLSDLLALNLIEDKDVVARKKIFRYYFSQDFDVSELREIPTSVFPRLITAMSGEESQVQVNAVYKFLQGIPKILHYQCGA